MTVDRDALHQCLRALAVPGQGPAGDLAGPLEQLTAAALAIPAAGSAALTLLGGQGRPVPVVVTGVPARAVEAAQLESGEGPLLAAVAGDRVVLSRALGSDGRWPRLARVAARLGAGGVVSVPVRVGGRPAGVLSALADTGHDWDDGEVATVTALAGVAAHLLLGAAAATGQDRRARVEQAKGVLAERAGIGTAEAADRLLAMARAERREVADVAAELVEGAARGTVAARANGSGGRRTAPLAVIDLVEHEPVPAPARVTAPLAGSTARAAGTALNGAPARVATGPEDNERPEDEGAEPVGSAPAGSAAGGSGDDGGPLEPELAQLDRVLASALAGRPADRLLPGLLGPVGRLAGADLVALLVTDPDRGGPILRCRAALGMATGAPPERAVADGGLEGLVMETGVPLLVADLDAGPGSPVLAAGGARSAAAVPLLAGGEPVGVLLAGRTARKPFSLRERARLVRAAERVSAAVARVRIEELARRDPAETGSAAERHARLAAVGAALAAAPTPAEVAEIVVTAGVAALGAASGLLEVVAGDGQLELLAADGYPPGVVEQFRRLPLDAAQPLTEAARRGRPIWLHDRDELAARYPALSEQVGDVREARACVPLVAGGRFLGMVAFGFDRPHRFEAGERTFVTALADLGARALDRAGGGAPRDEEAARAVLARERLAFQAESGALLGGTPSLSGSPVWRVALDQAVWLAVPRLADICVIMATSGGRLRPGGVAWSSPAAEAPLRALLAGCAPALGGGSPIAGVARSGRTWHKAVLTDEILGTVTSDPERLARLRALELTSAVIVPLLGRVELLGAIVLAQRGDRPPYRRADVTAAEELGRRAGLVLENGRRLGSDASPSP